MIAELKMGFKMLRYAYGIRSSIGCSLLFLLLGIAGSMLPAEMGNMWLDSYVILVVCMWPIQMLYSLSVSNMVQSSPWKKRLQTSVLTFVNLISFLLLYLLVLFIKWVQLTNGLRDMDRVIFELLFDGVLILIMMVFNGTSYKVFVTSTVVFIVLVIGISISGNFLYNFKLFQAIPLWAAVSFGFAAIAVGAVLQHVIALALYKKPISKLAQMAKLRKQLQ